MNTAIIRTSERRDAKRCTQRWHWAWREGLRPRDLDSSALWFGIGFHLAMAKWYCGPGLTRGPLPAETWAEYTEGALNYGRASRTTDEGVIKVWEDLTNLGAILCEEYVKKYGEDDSWHVIQPEKTFSIEIPWPSWQQLYDPEGAKGIMAKYAGTFDGVFRNLNTNKIWLMEHKTAKAISTAHLSLDPQAGAYSAVATRTLKAEGLIGAKEALSGIVYNFVRKTFPDTRPTDEAGYACNKPLIQNYLDAFEIYGVEPEGKKTLANLQAFAKQRGLKVIGERSKVQPPALFERHEIVRTASERKTQLLEIQKDAYVIQTMRDGLIPLTLTPTRDCHWDCSFYQMCELKQMNRNWEEFKGREYKVEDPYADHRKSTDEPA